MIDGKFHLHFVEHHLAPEFPLLANIEEDSVIESITKIFNQSWTIKEYSEFTLVISCYFGNMLIIAEKPNTINLLRDSLVKNGLIEE